MSKFKQKVLIHFVLMFILPTLGGLALITINPIETNIQIVEGISK